jgi:hypothetical protein
MLTSDEQPVYEEDNEETETDPDATPPPTRKLITQPYDLIIRTLLDQIDEKVLHLRPLSARPEFQRRYVWPDRLASALVESILLNIPIPPCYLSQNEDFELDVIDGQQRIYSIYRFARNQFRLSALEILKEFNGRRFHELNNRDQNKLMSHTLRCVVITNESDEEVKFDVFQRLNANTVPLNAQELRNCIYHGGLVALLPALTEYKPWLSILGRRTPDRRMRGEELVLRFFSFFLKGRHDYRTPQKHWLNDTAKGGRKFSDERLTELTEAWQTTISRCLLIFKPEECFRRLDAGKRSRVINRALMDLNMYTLARMSNEDAERVATDYRRQYVALLADEEFSDLISRSVDHKARTIRRFELWRERLAEPVAQIRDF